MVGVVTRHIPEFHHIIGTPNMPLTTCSLSCQALWAFSTIVSQPRNHWGLLLEQVPNSSCQVKFPIMPVALAENNSKCTSFTYSSNRSFSTMRGILIKILSCLNRMHTCMQYMYRMYHWLTTVRTYCDLGYVCVKLYYAVFSTREFENVIECSGYPKDLKYAEVGTFCNATLTFVNNRVLEHNCDTQAGMAGNT